MVSWEKQRSKDGTAWEMKQSGNSWNMINNWKGVSVREDIETNMQFL